MIIIRFDISICGRRQPITHLFRFVQQTSTCRKQQQPQQQITLTHRQWSLRPFIGRYLSIYRNRRGFTKQNSLLSLVCHCFGSDPEDAATIVIHKQIHHITQSRIAVILQPSVSMLIRFNGPIIVNSTVSLVRWLKNVSILLPPGNYTHGEIMERRDVSRCCQLVVIWERFPDLLGVQLYYYGS